ncbi:MAG: response regulator [Deltaproteobacteria bacterium]|nr:response regulator [Deltaproteobacteria bacterium]
MAREIGPANPTVLVVEDSKDVCFMICETLKYHIGCRVVTAMDGEECLRRVKEKPPDVILLDIHMPGMDGFEVCKILKGAEKTKHIPIIFLTATAYDMQSKIRGLEIGADDYLTQPVDNLELITRVKVMLRIKRLIDGAGKPVASGPQLSAERVHELRAPLNSIIGMAELIQEPSHGALTPKQKEFAEIISKNGRKLLKLINGLVDG